jgi:hypothetical protein
MGEWFKARKYTCAMLCIVAFCLNQQAIAQLKQTQFNGFGHLEYSLINNDSTDSYFSLGEHDFFVTSNLSNRISFLGEYVIRFNGKSATSFLPSIERSFLRFNYINNHNIIVGKIHTPVNYWNDVYHHGRVFFPVIDRPFAFTYIIPLHTLGLQLQGQNLGRWGFGYDAAIGNGIASTDNSQGGINPSLTAAVHIKPIPGLRIGASYYYNHLSQNTAGTHIGHSITQPVNPTNAYKGEVDFGLTCGSIAWFGKRFEFLNEFSFNQTRTDSLGTADNMSNFAYAGLRFNDRNVPFVLVDYIRIADNDLHVYPVEMLKFALGYRYEFNYLVNLKAQVEHTWMKHADDHLLHGHLGTLGFRVQLAYGF